MRRSAFEKFTALLPTQLRQRKHLSTPIDNCRRSLAPFRELPAHYAALVVFSSQRVRLASSLGIGAPVISAKR
jgi:hypothetical protein